MFFILLNCKGYLWRKSLKATGYYSKRRSLLGFANDESKGPSPAVVEGEIPTVFSLLEKGLQTRSGRRLCRRWRWNEDPASDIFIGETVFCYSNLPEYRVFTTLLFNLLPLKPHCYGYLLCSCSKLWLPRPEMVGRQFSYDDDFRKSTPCDQCTY